MSSKLQLMVKWFHLVEFGRLVFDSQLQMCTVFACVSQSNIISFPSQWNPLPNWPHIRYGSLAELTSTIYIRDLHDKTNLTCLHCVKLQWRWLFWHAVLPWSWLHFYVAIDVFPNYFKPPHQFMYLERLMPNGNYKISSNFIWEFRIWFQMCLHKD